MPKRRRPPGLHPFTEADLQRLLLRPADLDRWLIREKDLDRMLGPPTPPSSPSGPNEGSGKPSRAALRQRRRRERQREGLVALPPIDVDPVGVAFVLTEQGFPCDCDDPRSIAAAMQAYWQSVSEAGDE